MFGRGELTRSEALSVLAHDQADADLLAAAPWTEKDSITLGEVLRWRIVLALPMLAFDVANSIAMQAIQDVDPADRRHHHLMVAWNGCRCHTAWLSSPTIEVADVKRPFLIIPVAELLSDLASRLMDHRAQAAHLN